VLIRGAIKRNRFFDSLNSLRMTGFGMTDLSGRWSVVGGRSKAVESEKSVKSVPALRPSGFDAARKARWGAGNGQLTIDS